VRVPTKQKRAEVLLSEKELKAIRRRVKGDSVSNYFRALAGLPRLERGTAARKKKARKA
jgi:hypothetical protein